MTEWPSDQVTEWPSDQVTEWPSDQVTGSFADDWPDGIFSEKILTYSPCIILDKLTIEEFLANIGTDYKRYKENFDKQIITMEVLMNLVRGGDMNRVREVLFEIGITSFGHRHEILEAAKKLGWCLWKIKFIVVIYMLYQWPMCPSLSDKIWYLYCKNKTHFIIVKVRNSQ